MNTELLSQSASHSLAARAQNSRLRLSPFKSERQSAPRRNGTTMGLSSGHGLAHVPAKWSRFADKNMRQMENRERISIPQERNTL
jgi:hypothetical protein